MSFADAHEVPDVHKLKEQLTGWTADCYDSSLNYGNKTLKKRGGMRINQFAEWACNGHSLADGCKKRVWSHEPAFLCSTGRKGCVATGFRSRLLL
eukprot:scaffold910_cov396-Prasinococcus_capsulatus_cf.AAC.42